MVVVGGGVPYVPYSEAGKGQGTGRYYWQGTGLAGWLMAGLAGRAREGGWVGGREGGCTRARRASEGEGQGAARRRLTSMDTTV